MAVPPLELAALFSPLPDPGISVTLASAGGVDKSFYDPASGQTISLGALEGLVIALIGGTGPEGMGLALRLAQAGERIIIGSRSEARARAAADKIRARLPHADIRGAENVSAAREADVIIVTVPYEAHRETLESAPRSHRRKAPDRRCGTPEA